MGKYMPTMIDLENQKDTTLSILTKLLSEAKEEHIKREIIMAIPVVKKETNIKRIKDIGTYISTIVDRDGHSPEVYELLKKQKMTRSATRTGGKYKKRKTFKKRNKH